jgi:hypothetical protein
MVYNTGRRLVWLRLQGITRGSWRNPWNRGATGALLTSLPQNVDSLRIVLERSWFRRIWDLQESVLSRDPWIQCGSCLVRWNTFEKCLGFANLYEAEGKVFRDMA